MKTSSDAVKPLTKPSLPARGRVGRVARARKRRTVEILVHLLDGHAGRSAGVLPVAFPDASVGHRRGRGRPRRDRRRDEGGAGDREHAARQRRAARRGRIREPERRAGAEQAEEDDEPHASFRADLLHGLDDARARCASARIVRFAESAAARAGADPRRLSRALVWRFKASTCRKHALYYSLPEP